MRVVATGTGFDGVKLRVEGDEFDLPDTTNLDPKSDWFKPVEKKAEGKADKKDAKDLV